MRVHCPVLALACALCMACTAAQVKPAPPPTDRALTGVSIDKLAWLTGHWQRKDGANGSEEIWSAPLHGSMMGTNRSFKAGGVERFEFMRLRQTAGGIEYRAWPQGGPSTAFMLVELGAGRALFENRQHDFPQRIEYRRTEYRRTGTALTARITGTIEGKERAMQWRWTLAVAPRKEPAAAVKTAKIVEKKAKEPEKRGRVTGIGGIFFKSKDPAKLRAWYRQHLGLVTNKYGTLFEFREGANPQHKGYLQWRPFSQKTKYFAPSKREFMINYRVVNLTELLARLRKDGVRIVGKVEATEYGNFAHIIDAEGNKVELWEPVDSVFTRLYEGKTTL